MSDRAIRPPWTQPGWLERATAWIHVELRRQGIRVNGPIAQPHVRPWSTVLRASTTAGVIFFKATAPVIAHEPALTFALSRWRPDCMLPVLAIDRERGWMLMPDGGTTLRSLIRATRDIRAWHKALPLYAEVQIEMAGRVDELLVLGTPDRRLASLPAQFEQLLADTDALRLDLPYGLASEEYRRLRALAPKFAALCEQLAGYRVPETLHHGDFHDGNVFVRGGRYVFFDWGDSCLTHPFFSLRTVLVSIENSIGEEAAVAAFEPLRDAYLEAWTRYESRQNLLAAFNLAQRLWMIPSALGWHRALSGLEESLKEEYGHAVPALLQEFLETEAKASA